MKRNTILSTIIALALATFTAQAQAKLLYGKLGVGVGLAGSVGVDTTNIPGLGNSEMDLATGFPILAAVGFKFSPMLAIEGEFSYRADDFEDATDDSEGFSNTHIGANLVFDLPVPALPISPYLGGGALLQIPSYKDLEDIDLGVGFALQFFAGVNYAINPIVSVGVDLRYLLSIIDPSDSESMGGVEAEFDVNYSQFAALATVTVGF